MSKVRVLHRVPVGNDKCTASGAGRPHPPDKRGRKAAEFDSLAVYQMKKYRPLQSSSLSRRVSEPKPPRNILRCDFFQDGTVCSRNAIIWAQHKEKNHIYSRCSGHPLGDKILRNCTEMSAEEITCLQVMER